MRMLPDDTASTKSGRALKYSVRTRPSYAALLQKLHTEVGTDKTQVVMIAATVVNSGPLPGYDMRRPEGAALASGSFHNQVRTALSHDTLVRNVYSGVTATNSRQTDSKWLALSVACSSA